ncbi:hypothetical protein HN51_058931 [Arachis hypogaea]
MLENLNCMCKKSISLVKKGLKWHQHYMKGVARVTQIERMMILESVDTVTVMLMVPLQCCNEFHVYGLKSPLCGHYEF